MKPTEYKQNHVGSFYFQWNHVKTKQNQMIHMICSYKHKQNFENTNVY